MPDTLRLTGWLVMLLSLAPAVGAVADDDATTWTREVEPLAVHLDAPVTARPDLATTLTAYLAGLPFVQLDAQPADADAHVYCDLPADATTTSPLVVGIRMPDGRTAMEMGGLDAARLEVLAIELRRIYLVENLTRLRNPGSPFDVTVSLAGGETRIAGGEEMVFEVSSQRAGYITLVNVDSRGNVTMLLPNRFQLEAVIGPGETVRVPANQAAFKLTARPPFGREFIKAFVSERQVRLPVFGSLEHPGAFATLDSKEDVRDWLFRMRTQLMPDAVAADAEPGVIDFADLEPNQWGEASFVFQTTP